MTRRKGEGNARKACSKDCHRSVKISWVNYIWYIRNFSSFSTSMIDYTRKTRLNGLRKLIKPLHGSRRSLATAPILAMHDFEVFELKCDGIGVGIGVLSKQKQPNAFMSQKLNEARQKWSTYEQELYAIFKSLKTRASYLI